MPTVYVSMFLAFLFFWALRHFQHCTLSSCVDCVPRPHVTWPSHVDCMPHPNITWPSHVDCIPHPNITWPSHVTVCHALISHDPHMLTVCHALISHDPHMLTICHALISHDPHMLTVRHAPMSHDPHVDCMPLPHVTWPRCSMQTAATTTRWGTSELITLGGRGYLARETCLPSCHTSTHKRWDMLAC